MRKLYILLGFISSLSAFSQNSGNFSGSFYANTNGFIKDDKIGANGNTVSLYTKELSSTEGWFNANYSYSGFNAALRFDLYHNSNLLTPSQAYTANGIAYWQLSKEVDKFNFAVGSFYDQIGSGSIFRAYWEPFVGIDNAIQGARVIYKPTESLMIKAFSGKQKYRFDYRKSIIKGVNVEKSISIGEHLNMDWGLGLTNRTIDKTTMNGIADEINTYLLSDRFKPKYNVFAYTIYNTTNFKDFGLNLEYSGKTTDAIANTQGNQIIERNGSMYQGSLSYSHFGEKSGIGVNMTYRRLENFQLRTSPLEIGLDGLYNYIPTLTRQNTYRLMARYNAVPQMNGEQCFQSDIVYSPNEKVVIQANFSNVTNLEKLKLFREIYLDATYTPNEKMKVMIGIQNINYNQETLEGKPGVPTVKTITPFTEVILHVKEGQSLRIEFQSLNTHEDFGSFLNGMLEYTVAPHWSFAAGDMINIKPKKTNDKLNYYTFFAGYTEKATRVTLAYIKQLEGFNCTGGVCRYEPAFNGVRLTLSSNF